jgi:hypothetical protein
LVIGGAHSGVTLPHAFPRRCRRRAAAKFSFLASFACGLRCLLHRFLGGQFMFVLCIFWAVHAISNDQIDCYASDATEIEQRFLELFARLLSIQLPLGLQPIVVIAAMCAASAHMAFIGCAPDCIFSSGRGHGIGRRRSFPAPSARRPRPSLTFPVSTCHTFTPRVRAGNTIGPAARCATRNKWPWGRSHFDAGGSPISGAGADAPPGGRLPGPVAGLRKP